MDSGSRLLILFMGALIAQGAERPTEKPGAVLTRVPVAGAARDFSPRVSFQCKFQALVYDILPSTTAVFSFAIGSRKLSANEHFFFIFFFIGAQTLVSLLQTTQIISDVCFITDHVLTPAQLKPKSLESRRTLFFLFFLPGVDAPHVYVRA